MTKEAAVTFNLQQTEITGENHALLFPERLEGAIARPWNAWYWDGVYDVIDLTVNIMVAIPQAHAFEQGNKRTGFVAGFAFLAANGYDLVAEADSVSLAVLHTEAILGEGNPGEFEEYLRNFTYQL
ncbi:type II toxin-antitoxin system death-on-curing family toxin [Ensifer sp. ENS04]|uniref:type II toxin-antitoxin system death-on-curing family toxin n=1 Tax=Ensifer sp. ENS04 TaxID=2769281 RepID=UPI00178310C4|nr:type II toxin-antitoxin system death-on-curing family toxin [Ensifer sp. ENS04]